MNACICNSCKNLKSIVDESSLSANEIIEECVFGFPSENCLDCELEACELSCEHFEKRDDEVQYKISKCKKCDQELNYVSIDCKEDDVYCVACFLNK